MYDVSMTFSISGEPDVTVTGCCHDEACYLKCWDALDEAIAEVKAFRKKHKHEAMIAKPGHKGSCVNLQITVTLDGAPELGPTSFPCHNVPAAAVSEMKRVMKKFLIHKHVAPCVNP